MSELPTSSAPVDAEAAADAVLASLPENPSPEDVHAAVKAVVGDPIIKVTVNLRREVYQALQELAVANDTDLTKALHAAIIGEYARLQARLSSERSRARK